MCCGFPSRRRTSTCVIPGRKLTGSTFRDDSGGNRGGSWERTVTTQPIVARTTIRPGMPTPDALTDRFLAWKPFMGKPWRTGCVSCRVSVANRLCQLPGVIKTRQLKQPVRRSSSAAYTPGISRPVRIGVPGTTAAVSLLPPGLRVRWPGWGELPSSPESTRIGEKGLRR